ncbi:MAG: diaminopimelate epimerase [bacterium]|nr:diaminopimelate epimerase [bacterium]
MHLTKHHVFGNDFLVRLEPHGAPCPVGWVRGVCDRTRGIGADGVMWAQSLPSNTDDPPSRHSGESRNPVSGGLICAPEGVGEHTPGGTGAGSMGGSSPLRAEMRLYNADGGEAEVSGNGLACLAQALTLRAGRDEAEVLIATAAGERSVAIGNSRFAGADDAGDSFGRIRSRAAIDLGQASEDEERTGRVREVLAALAPAVSRAGWMSVGNPHVVALLEDEAALGTLALELAGAALQTRFEPVNFEAVTVVDRTRVRMRVFERGVGVTSACGSGAAAAAWRLHGWGLVDEAIRVEMPGGVAEVSVASGVELRVPVIYVADVEAPEPAAPTGGGTT